MKTVTCDNNIHLEIESSEAEFLIMEEWALQNLNEAELSIYKQADLTEEKKALFDRWTADQKITYVKVYVNNVLQ